MNRPSPVNAYSAVSSERPSRTTFRIYCSWASCGRDCALTLGNFYKAPFFDTSRAGGNFHHKQRAISPDAPHTGDLDCHHPRTRAAATGLAQRNGGYHKAAKHTHVSLPSLFVLSRRTSGDVATLKPKRHCCCE